ncbi:Acetolactate synthase-like protein [Trichinella pseudospiralis]|uniref:2-hydroxyacyl-CoA lyase 2 n=3 Tax=Trichinella pseudospiralis TaxID=6337 RepID=A0A0V1IR10_TRIPS|nr:Acetolactate synthase-like protein [Trichinella pseudospiralis]
MDNTFKLDLTSASVALLVCLAIIVVQYTWMKIFRRFKVLQHCQSRLTNHGGEIVARVLLEHNVNFVFTLCGGHISPILAACENLNIRIIDTRHEATAVFAADAMSRLSGKIGVACVTAGPGVANTIVALKNAQMAESSVLLLAGASPTLLKGRGPLQDMDQIALVKSICKCAVTVTRIKDISKKLRPVFVELPVEVLYPFDIVKNQMGIKENCKRFWDRIINFYLRWALCRLFQDAELEFDCSPLTPHLTETRIADVELVKQMLARSSRPLMLLGSQLMANFENIHQLKGAIELIGIPCYCSGMSRGVLSDDSELLFRHKRREALKQADFILLVGAVCDFRLNYGKSLNPMADVVVVNRGKNQIKMNAGWFWKLSHGICADPSDFLIKLSLANVNDSLKESRFSGWMKILRDQENLQELEIIKLTEQNSIDQNLLNSILLLKKVDSAAPDDAIFVFDGGDFVGSASYIIRPRGCLKWLDPGPFGTLGIGAGFAIAAKLCHPNLPVWIIYGDGAVGYSLLEFDTFARHKLPVVAVVGNDARWSQIHRTQTSIFGTAVGCVLEYSSYEKVAAAFHFKGIKIDGTNEKTVEGILNEVPQLNAHGIGVLLNCYISPSDFRDGSISL